MRCNFIRKLLSAQLDEELSSSKARILKEHLNECNMCRQIYSDFVSINRLAKETGVPEPSERLWQKIRNSLVCKQKKQTKQTFPIIFFLRNYRPLGYIKHQGRALI